MLVVVPLVQVKPAEQVPFIVLAGPPEALPPNSFIRIRGLPDGVNPLRGPSSGQGDLGCSGLRRSPVEAARAGRRQRAH